MALQPSTVDLPSPKAKKSPLLQLIDFRLVPFRSPLLRESSHRSFFADINIREEKSVVFLRSLFHRLLRCFTSAGSLICAMYLRICNLVFH